MKMKPKVEAGPMRGGMETYLMGLKLCCGEAKRLRRNGGEPTRHDRTHEIL